MKSGNTKLIRKRAADLADDAIIEGKHLQQGGKEMPQARKVTVRCIQANELRRARDFHPLFSVRTKAAAILKIAVGASIFQVATEGLLRCYDDNTVREWLNRYEAEGLDGLEIRPGCGRKPSFSPYRLGC